MDQLNVEEGVNLALRDLIPQIIHYGKMLLFAILIFVIGWWIIKKMVSGLRKFIEFRGWDATLQPFVVSIVSVILKLLLIISVISYVGIPMTSFVALLGAAGLAVGMAFSGTLQNFAGGVILLIIKPFKVDDLIESQGIIGTVKEIQMFNTFLLSTDNRAVIMPNGSLATGIIINYSRMETRRVELRFPISHHDDIERVKQIIRNVFMANDKVLHDPEPVVAVMTITESNIDMVCRVWVKTTDYWEVYFHMNEHVKNELDREGIKLGVPQRTIHMVQK